ncbi:bifunctional riboflavin kinase/FAD synthetase [candidate division KSB1 bacterium]|nr:bifunctional riboflavin kinase/FAD synthetase [candidate division KSB1 bacterium]
METFWDFNNIYPKSDSILTVGTFDGIHLGHIEIIKELVLRVKKSKAKSTLVTFEPHPGLVIGKRGPTPLALLTTIEEKIDVLASIGLERLVITNFTGSFASMTAEEFVQNILINKLNMKQIVIGHDHSFGKDRKGDFNLLVELGKKYNFEVDAIDPIRVNNEIVSSTKIRNLLFNGEIQKANEIIGRNYSIRGQVVKGDGRGRELGFPTANIRSYSQYKLIPKEGVYATKIKINNKVFNSVTYIGPRPTFNLNQKVIEVHIDKFDKEIYNKEVELYFTHFIREDKKFKTKSELVPQIQSDKNDAMKILNRI